MKINSMDIKNYRNFSDLHVDFDPRLTVFVGANGSGKTTILDALVIFLEMISRSSLSYPHESIISLKDVKIKNNNNQIIDSHISYKFYYENNYKNFISYTVYHQKKTHALKQFNDTEKIIKFIDNTMKPVVVNYGSKRIVNNYQRESSAHSEYEYAFKNAFNAGIDFSSTLTWFIEKSAEEAMQGRRKRDLDYTIPELDAARKAVSKALGNYNEPYADGTPPQLFITHTATPDIPLSLQQLSDGYRTMLALVMDLARRMALAAQKYKNEIKNALDYPAIVLIDEVELHLHPAWQQRVLPSLLEIFPNTQFIVTTHSPQIISSIEPKHLRILSQNRVSLPSSSTYGAESQRVLEEVFGVTARYSENEAKKALDAYFELIHKGEYESEQAKEYRSKLDEWLNGDPALDSADMLIRRARRIQGRGTGNAEA